MKIKKVGFVDLSSAKSGDINIFVGRNGKYELEKSIEYAGENVSSLNAEAIDEFYLSLPLEMLNFRLLKLPFSDKEKLMKVVPFELESLIIESPDNVVFDATVLDGSALSDKSALADKADKGFAVLVTYIGKETLGETLTRLAALNIDPQIITSIELQAVKKGGAEDIAARLINPGKISRDERIAAAKTELLQHTVNLRRGPFAYTKDLEKIKKTLKVTAALFIALLLIMNAYLAFRIAAAKNEASSVKREMRNIYAGLFPDEKKITDELYQLRSHMKEIKEKGDAMIGVYPLRFLLDLSRKTMQGVALNEISLDKDLIVMKGEASSMGDIDKAKAGLSESLVDVSVSDIRPSAGGKVFFTIVAKGRK